MRKAIEWRRRIEEEKQAPHWKNEFSLNCGQSVCKELPHCRVEGQWGQLTGLYLSFVSMKRILTERKKRKHV